MRHLLLGLTALLLSACAIDPVPNRSCDFVIRELEVPQPSRGLGPPVPTFEEVIRQSYAADRAVPNYLFMSGGSEKGAFGAGVIKAWGERRRGLPRFDVVTGVSTGALLATPAFLGDYPYAAWAYSNVRENQLLKPFVRRNSSGGLSTASYLAVVKNGAVASLDPMRNLLADYLTDERYQAIADRAATSKLLVGAVDMESGKAVALDLTDMAVKVTRASSPEDKNHFKQCYMDAIQASASAPLAATPVYFNNRMYVDGGVRFGLFSEKVMDTIRDIQKERKAAGRPPPLPPKLYLIVNGDQETEAWCDEGSKKDGRDCIAVADPLARADKVRQRNLLELGFRSIDLLTNQLYRFSVRHIAADNGLVFGESANNLHFLRIDEDVKGFTFRDEQGREMTCPEWRKEDDRVDRPLQFHHRYMQCLVAYGADAATKAGW